jgi:hypothetical protein
LGGRWERHKLNRSFKKGRLYVKYGLLLLPWYGRNQGNSIFTAAGLKKFVMDKSFGIRRYRKACLTPVPWNSMRTVMIAVMLKKPLLLEQLSLSIGAIGYVTLKIALETDN